ncbi:hypothetical protein OUZ56_020744 [Daphnia magna]|uniref:Uncharacterized protein n=1 Tax=Daphnia magna TaxID=35525 RepID=A0ABQ9ZFC0_9CRUS|nr:hypothetical protein OUZ56_020744 [Daphnia magna]
MVTCGTLLTDIGPTCENSIFFPSVGLICEKSMTCGTHGILLLQILHIVQGILMIEVSLKKYHKTVPPPHTPKVASADRCRCVRGPT